MQQKLRQINSHKNCSNWKKTIYSKIATKIERKSKTHKNCKNCNKITHTHKHTKQITKAVTNQHTQKHKKCEQQSQNLILFQVVFFFIIISFIFFNFLLFFYYYNFLFFRNFYLFYFLFICVFCFYYGRKCNGSVKRQGKASTGGHHRDEWGEGWWDGCFYYYFV